VVVSAPQHLGSKLVVTLLVRQWFNLIAYNAPVYPMALAPRREEFVKLSMLTLEMLTTHDLRINHPHPHF
jgi:hypothetical protein